MAFEEGSEEAMAAIQRVREAERARRETQAARRKAQEFRLDKPVTSHGSRFVATDALDFVPHDVKINTSRE